ncbi:mCG1034314, partial [Mus musculus]
LHCLYWKASYIDGAPHEHDESSCEGTEPSAIQPLFGNFIFLLSLAVCYMLPVEWNICRHFKGTALCPTKAPGTTDFGSVGSIWIKSSIVAD